MSTTPPVFLGDAAELGSLSAGDRLTLAGPEGRHAATVRRLRPGEAVDVVDGAGLRVRCEVSDAGRDRVVLRVLAVGRDRQPAPRLVVATALLKGEAADRAVAMLTEIGVDEFLPWEAERSVARWDSDRTDHGVRRWRATAAAAAKQARRAWIPHVSTPSDLAGLCARIGTAQLALVLHESAVAPIGGLTWPRGGEVLLVVGPEGGITEPELAAITAAGAVAVRLGPEILRAATAAAAALAVAACQTGRW